MNNPHAFLIATTSSLCALCAVTALAMAPVTGNRTASPAAFAFFGTMAAAAAALTAAAAADALTPASRRR